MTTTNQQLELEKAVTRLLYFAEFQFKSQTLRLNNSSQTLDWGGYTWAGTGALGAVSEVRESEGLETSALTFTLNAVQESWLAIAVGAADNYRRRPAKLYRCPLNDQFQLIDTPEVCWTGLMDTIAVGVGSDGKAQISLKCETSANSLRRLSGMRMNAAQLKQQYPNACGLDYLADLIANPQTWASVTFQRFWANNQG